MLATEHIRQSDASSSHLRASDLLLEQLNSLIESHPNPSTEGVKIRRIEVSVPRQDPLLWLLSQSGDKKTFWRGRDGDEQIAGIGETLVFESEQGYSNEMMLQRIRKILSNSSDSLKMFGGMRFNQNSDSISKEWHLWKHSRFIIPEIELIRSQEDTRLICNLNFSELGDSDRILRLKKTICGLKDPDFTKFSEFPFQYFNKKYIPSYRKWCSNVDQAITEIRSGTLQKIVLARTAEYEMSKAYDPLQLLMNLRDRAPHAYQFCFQIDKNQTWLGISPERLYRRQLRKLETEAVASTRPRGKDPDGDKILAEELLQSQKEVREHDLVLEKIESLLKQFCDKTERQSYKEVLKLKYVQHLLSRVEGTLNQENGDSALLNGIHPTPAVSGIPNEEAQSRIEQLEKFDRGWYTGPVGWISKNGAEFAVAIRSALMDHQTLRIYTGAGIVEGSNPDSEWQEINAKLRNWESILEPV